MNDDSRPTPGHTAQHLSEERCNDILLGLASPADAEAAGRHAAVCTRCEALLQRLSAEFELLRIRPTPVRGAAGTWVSADAPDRGAVVVGESAVPPSAARRAPGRRAWIAGLATAALVVLVLSWGRLTTRAPESDTTSYWIPVASDVLRNRSAVTAADSSFDAGLQAYAAHSADAAIALLQEPLTEDGWDDLRRLYLASALANTSQHDAALALLDELDVGTLPQPWRDHAHWVRFLALEASGHRGEADALLQTLRESPTDIGVRARQHRRPEAP